MRILFSGGGTGGHIFPAIAIADAIKNKNPEAEILFVGAKGKMEMDRVPKAGYPIKGLWISGLQRKLSWRNLSFPFKLISSLIKARKILKDFYPDVVVGVGGYASGPTLEMAARAGIPTLIQEQNSFPGITNRLLAKKVNTICVAYESMERYFPKAKLVMTGNPVRKQIVEFDKLNKADFSHFDLVLDKKTILVFGGSLGARSLNEAVASQYDLLHQRQDIQLIWQVGKLYFKEFKNCPVAQLNNVKIMPFIEQMEKAYKVADVIISRAGALTIAELCIVGKPSILVPSPNVAEDHQTKNAMALVEKNATVLVADKDANAQMLKKATDLLGDNKKCLELSKSIQDLAIKDADVRIANEIVRLLRNV